MPTDTPCALIAAGHAIRPITYWRRTPAYKRHDVASIGVWSDFGDRLSDGSCCALNRSRITRLAKSDKHHVREKSLGVGRVIGVEDGPTPLAVTDRLIIHTLA